MKILLVKTDLSLGYILLLTNLYLFIYFLADKFQTFKFVKKNCIHVFTMSYRFIKIHMLLLDELNKFLEDRSL